MRQTIGKAMLGGLLGTALMTGMMRFVAPMMLGHPMDLAAMLGKMMRGSWASGMAVHLANGILIFPLAYGIVAKGLLPGTPVARGILWGVALWILAETIVMPMAGAGFFSSEIGGMKAVVAALLGHVVYGAVLGATVGDGDSK